LAALQRELTDVISLTEDQVLFVGLGPTESRGERVIAALGKPYTKLDAPCYVV
jgi:CRISPR-associated protein Cas2